MHHGLSLGRPLNLALDTCSITTLLMIIKQAVKAV